MKETTIADKRFYELRTAKTDDTSESPIDHAKSVFSNEAMNSFDQGDKSFFIYRDYSIAEVTFERSEALGRVIRPLGKRSP